MLRNARRCHCDEATTRPRPAMGQLDLGLGAVTRYRYDPTLPASTTTTIIVGSEIEILHRYPTPPSPPPPSSPATTLTVL